MKTDLFFNRLGFNPNLTTRQSRVDSVSIASRYRVLATLLLCLTLFVGSGNVWGAVQSGWVRVTNVAHIKSGGTFVIGYEASANSNVIVPLRSDGAAATTSANGLLYSGTTAGSAGSGTIDMASATTTNYEVTIVAGYATDYISIKMASGNYIGNSGSKNIARLYTSVSINSSYKPTIGSNDVVTLTSPTSVSTTYTTLQYNSGSPRYCNYGGGQKNVVMYKKLCTVTFNANGGSVSPSSRTQASADATISLPTPTRSGFTCTGWYTASSGGTKRGDAGGSYTPTANETLYAQWVSAGTSVSLTKAASSNGSLFCTALCALLSL